MFKAWKTAIPNIDLATQKKSNKKKKKKSKQ